MEKRGLIRNRIRIPVVCSNLTTNSQAVVFRGTMLNCSYAGSCIEMDYQFNKGSIVMIRATFLPMEETSMDLIEGFRSLAVAEVKWSKPLTDSSAHNYAIGLRYLPN